MSTLNLTSGSDGVIFILPLEKQQSALVFDVVNIHSFKN